jgi:hypothetical protein
LQRNSSRAPKCQLVGPKGDSIPLPESVFFVLERVAEVMARGDSITVVPVGREVTTQQAADLLTFTAAATTWRSFTSFCIAAMRGS